MGIEISKMGSRGMRRVFEAEATAGQTDFTVTQYAINEHYLLIIDDLPQTANSTRSGQTITFTPGCMEGSLVVIYN